MWTEAETVREHRSKFNEWLLTTKQNSTLISKNDLELVKGYLLAQGNGTTYEIPPNLLRRIKSNNFLLANFPSSTDCVCVLNKDRKGKENKLPMVKIYV